MAALQPRSRIALLAALLLGALWVVSLDEAVVPEDTPLMTQRPRPAPPVVLQPRAPLVGDSGSEVEALKAEVARLKARVAELEAAASDASATATDARALTSLRKALADCKREAASAVAGKARHPDEGARSRPLHVEAPDNAHRSAAIQPPATRPPTPPPAVDSDDAPVVVAKPRTQGRRNVAPNSVGTIPVVIFTYNRPQLLERTMEAVLRVMPDRGFQLFVSQDGTQTPGIAETIKRVQAKYPERTVRHIVHQRDDAGATPEEIDRGWQPYYAIAHHYKSTVDKVFASSAAFKRVILLEDDMEVAHDFFELMEATAPLFDRDATLYCVSGFNDNGKPEHATDAAVLYRSDFFSGLGWMTSREIWTELSAIWPKGFWDDWMRQPDKRKGRSCIRPEVPRSRTVCSETGVSAGQFCEHLERIHLAHEFIDWTKQDLSYLLRPAYDKYFKAIITDARPVRTVFEVETLPSTVKEAKIRYGTNDELVALEQQLDIMTDFKDGVPRTAYHGVVSIRFKRRRLHLVPTAELYVYD